MKEGGCCLPPSYVRAVNFHNSTGKDANIIVTFESGAKETLVCKESSDLHVEREIDQGSFTTVDPVLEFTVDHPSKETNIASENIKGVEIRNYDIGENGLVKCLGVKE